MRSPNPDGLPVGFAQGAGFAEGAAKPVPGNSNRGHEFRAGNLGEGVIGPELTDGQRWEIVEFLKTY